MKLSSKPISSPGRAEKYPPPLMRFLRSNVGSRSRGRSRSSPMFVRKKNTTIETQEPSSPKVTCMGQVRVKRSKQSGSSKSGAPTKKRCKWFKHFFSCHHFTWIQHKPKPCRPNWRKWVWLFRVGFKRKSKIRQDSSKFESKFSNNSEDVVQENEVEEHEDEDEDEDEEDEATKVFVSTTSSPPKNALLLMRCRSAPYRSSSLASRFWGSPLTNQEIAQEQENNKEEEEEEEVHISDQETEEKFVSIEEMKTGGATVVQPLILTRCKSEPARTAEKLDPDLSYWNKRRLGFI